MNFPNRYKWSKSWPVHIIKTVKESSATQQKTKVGDIKGVLLNSITVFIMLTTLVVLLGQLVLGQNARTPF